MLVEGGYHCGEDRGQKEGKEERTKTPPDGANIRVEVNQCGGGEPPQMK